jgi:hypothetical protein
MLGGEFKISSATVNLYAGQITIENFKEDTPLDLKTIYLIGQKREKTDVLSACLTLFFYNIKKDLFNLFNDIVPVLVL